MAGPPRFRRGMGTSTVQIPSVDPIGQAGGANVNLYAYGDPLSYTDPLGERGFASLVAPVAVGAVIGGISGGVGAAIQGVSVSEGATRGALLGAAAGVGSGLIINGVGPGVFSAAEAAVLVTMLRAGTGYVGNLIGQGVNKDPCRTVSFESALFSGLGGAITAPLGIGLGLAGTELGVGARVLLGATSIPGTVVFNTAGAQVNRPLAQCSCPR